MPSPCPGQIFLTGLTTLKNRRQIPNEPTFFYDADIACVDPPHYILGSLRHIVSANSDPKPDGIYNINAKVLQPTTLLCMINLILTPDSCLPSQSIYTWPSQQKQSIQTVWRNS